MFFMMSSSRNGFSAWSENSGDFEKFGNKDRKKICCRNFETELKSKYMKSQKLPKYSLEIEWLRFFGFYLNRNVLSQSSIRRISVYVLSKIEFPGNCTRITHLNHTCQAPIRLLPSSRRPP